ncbi:MAG TPA: hypothetical protein VHK03_15015 [Aestuariivirgaceae bacterium]|jgi:hypothetical protein|nr:hypothetical protein [Aestuariivirgaceae bacterium]
MTGTNVVSELPAAHAVAAWSACAGCVKVICSFNASYAPQHLRRSKIVRRNDPARVRLEEVRITKE